MTRSSIAQFGRRSVLACGCQIQRRGLLTGLASFAAQAVLPGKVLSAQTAPGKAAEAHGGTPHAIDVHHHFVPPAYLKAAPSLVPPLAHWTPARDVEDIDASGTQTAILSLTTPGIWFGDAEKARELARLFNDYAAKMIADYPGRYRLFAVLPLPDIDGSLREIEYGLDVLKAEGVCMFTSYESSWLGDARFAPVFEELNRRKAVVYTHPTDNQCCSNLLTSLRPSFPPSVIEYGADTTRAIASYLFSGAARRYPGVQMIFSHGGGTMPFLIERFVTHAARPGADAALPPDGLTAALGRFYYDTAQTADPVAMGALRGVVPVSQILFGTDFPFRTTKNDVDGLKTAGFSDQDLAKIFRENAQRLMPQLPA